MERTAPSRWTGHSFTRGTGTISLGRGVKEPAENLSFSKRNLSRLSSGTGFCPVSGASASTCCHKSGEGILITHSGRSSKFLRVLVSLRSPTVIVHPKAQNDEIGARLEVSSSFHEVISATGLPKYKIFGAIALNPGSSCAHHTTRWINVGRAEIRNCASRHMIATIGSS